MDSGPSRKRTHACSGTFKKTGRPFSAAFAHVWTVRGDRLAGFNMHTDTAKVLEAVQS